MSRCSICFESHYSFYFAGCKDQFCKTCFNRYVQELIQNSWGLSVQKIKCPVCSVHLNIEEWSRHVDPVLVKKFQDQNQPFRPVSRYCHHCEGEVTFAELPLNSQSEKQKEFEEIYQLVCDFCSSSYWVDPAAMSLLDAFKQKYTDHLNRNTVAVIDIYKSLIKDLRIYTCSFGRTGSDLAQFSELDPITVNALATISQKFIKLESRPDSWREVQFSHIIHFPRVECFTCAAEMCFTCGETPFHEGFTCQESMEYKLHREMGTPDQLATLKWTLENSKRCPKCAILINREEGCNKVDCLYCGYKFCWLCMNEFDTSKCGFYKCIKTGDNQCATIMDDHAELGVPDVISIHSKSSSPQSSLPNPTSVPASGSRV